MGLFDAGARHDRPATVHERRLTLPNAISLLRLLALPAFPWLVLGPERLWPAVAVLAAIASTDWIDGYLARRLDQVSRLGTVMDPLVDRAVLATAAITLVVADVVPWPLAALVVGRDVVLLSTAFALFGRLPPIKVNAAGKLATACLLAAFPAFVLAAVDWPGQDAFVVASWGLAIVGVVAYYVAGAWYAAAAARLRRAARVDAAGSA